MTYGKIGEWRFDKRSYDNVWPPRNLPLPPAGVPESVVCPLVIHNSLSMHLWVDNDIIWYDMAGDVGEDGEWSHSQHSELGILSFIQVFLHMYLTYLSLLLSSVLYTTQWIVSLLLNIQHPSSRNHGPATCKSWWGTIYIFCTQLTLSLSLVRW